MGLQSQGKLFHKPHHRLDNQVIIGVGGSLH